MVLQTKAVFLDKKSRDNPCRKNFLLLISVFADEVEQFLDGLFLRDILFHAFLGFIEGDLTAPSTYITVVGIGHLTRTVDDTTHDADLQTHEVFRGSLDLGDGLLQVIERTPTTRTRDILRLCELDARGLQDAVGKFHEFSLVETRIVDHKLMGLLVYQQRTDGHSGLQLQRLPIGLMHIECDGVVLDTCLAPVDRGFSGFGRLYKIAWL